MWVAVVGGLGTGKERIAKMISEKDKFNLYQEEAVDLALEFQLNPAKHAFRHQLLLMINKFSQQIKIQNRRDNSNIVSTRLVEDIFIFSQFLLEFEFLSFEDFRIIESIYKKQRVALNPPDIVILLKSSQTITNHVSKELSGKVCNFTNSEYIVDLNARYEALAENIAVPLIEVDIHSDFDTTWGQIEHGIESLKTTRLVGQTIWETPLLRSEL